MKTLTPDELRAELRKRIAKEFDGNVSAAARAWKYPPQNLHAVLGRRLGPSDNLLHGAGFKWVIVRA